VAGSVCNIGSVWFFCAPFKLLEAFCGCQKHTMRPSQNRFVPLNAWFDRRQQTERNDYSFTNSTLSWFACQNLVYGWRKQIVLHWSWEMQRTVFFTPLPNHLPLAPWGATGGRVTVFFAPLPNFPHVSCTSPPYLVDFLFKRWPSSSISSMAPVLVWRGRWSAHYRAHQRAWQAPGQEVFCRNECCSHVRRAVVL